jgi:hypothetical protein
MKEFPNPGDLIIVDRSDWLWLPSGNNLRVCEYGEPSEYMDPQSGILTAPRSMVNTFWGPNVGLSDGIKTERMKSSGGPFKWIAFDDLDGIEKLGTVTDCFWCWAGVPGNEPSDCVDRMIEVNLWRLPILLDF